MVFTAATEEKETYLIDRGAIPIPVAAATKIVRGVFVELQDDLVGLYYGRTSQDAAGHPPAGVAMDTIDNSAGAAGAKFVRVCPSGIGVFPTRDATALIPGTDLYVDSAVDGNTLTSAAGNYKVGTTIYPARKTSEPYAAACDYIWVHINCMMP